MKMDISNYIPLLVKFDLSILSSAVVEIIELF